MAAQVTIKAHAMVFADMHGSSTRYKLHVLYMEIGSHSDAYYEYAKATCVWVVIKKAASLELDVLRN